MRTNLDLIKKFNKTISQNTNLANYSWFNLGGPAEFFFKPENTKQMIEFFKANKRNKLKITILGAGSNTLIRDNGVKGVVIKLGNKFSNIQLIEKDIIEVGAATLDRKIANFALENGLSNLEFLSCIPGSIGGSVAMNSGCYDGDISKILVSVKVIDIDECVEKEIKRNEIEFFYRGTSLPAEFIITSVKLKGKLEDKEIIKKKQESYIEKKNYLNQVKSKRVEALLKISVVKRKLGN